jgi:hypothetical protein
MAGIKHPFMKQLLLPLLLLCFMFSVTVLGLAAWVKDHVIDYAEDPQNYDIWSDFHGNAATLDLINFALIGGMVAVASYIIAFHHMRVRTTPSLTAAQGAAWIALMLLILPFALAWKELQLKNRGVGLIVLEAFVVFLTLIHFLYTLHLYFVER